MLKEHKKMYKAGKNWLIMGITSFAVVGAVSQLDNMGIKSAKAVMPNQSKQVASADQRDFNTKPYVGYIMGNEIDFDSYEDAIVGRYMDIPVTHLLDSDNHYLNMGFQNVYVHLDPDTGMLYASIMQSYSKLLIRQDTGQEIEFHWNPPFGPGTPDHAFPIYDMTRDGSYVKKLDKNKCIKYFELRPLNTF
ncbi:KxYKxGKxW signal peptide domain-containing protein [Fructobacillus sp. W13]|uniref:KxYKxGKxW signal peptide domain-containing protein n=1 Tax=Fructobacillus apis TaxID=2935017 RepID=A0ABT0ZQ77_9LACO|nr:KxYKxGKxW signal peptide domain-containing protein [Fructobacillus apis]MCO0832152.1 KxYKxGKxW signal peptide domain-containing protein [Fructobacillus apis]